MLQVKTVTDVLILTPFIVVNALPAVYAGADTAICIYDSVLVQATGTILYSWSNGILNGNISHPIVIHLNGYWSGQ